MLHSRTKRVEESLRQALATIFQMDLKDPRLPAIFTVSRVSVSHDLRNATVHYSQLPDDEDARAATEEMLDDCMGYIRTRVARVVNLKFTPEMVFKYSPGEQHYQRINSILQNLHEESPEEGPEKD